METRLSCNHSASHTDGCDNSWKTSSYPESESAYLRRVYGSDHTVQLHDDHAVKAMIHYGLPTRKKAIKRIHDQNDHLICENADPSVFKPGRSAYSLKLLSENLHAYGRKQFRSLRWNEHYRAAVQSVADDLQQLLNGKKLQPIQLEDVARSESIQRNLNKNAGYYGFLIEKRSKGECLDEAIEWITSHVKDILEWGHYRMPMSIAHRSSNSKPTDDKHWKLRCRIILMQDIRAMLLDGRFAIPFLKVFMDMPWGEGGMTHEQVATWVNIVREHYSSYYSSDYSKFDISQPAWLLEDVFDKIVRPCFGKLSDEDSKLFDAMRESYIHKVIHGFDGAVIADGCQVSGALTTYAYNTIVNEIMDRTSLLMQGCDLRGFKSLKCGDDNLTYYNKTEPWNAKKHCEIIERYFGVKTTLGTDDCGEARYDDPTFLSRKWTRSGAERPIREMIWNLTFPERYRNYDPKVTGISRKRAVALLLLCACLEQEKTAREWFDVHQIRIDAGVATSGDVKRQVLQALEKIGTGFNDHKVQYLLSQMRKVS